MTTPSAPLTSSERFALVNNELGWGDPEGGLWFLGLEENSSWTPEERDRIAIHYGHGKYFRDEQDDVLSLAHATPNALEKRNFSQIAVFESKIAAAVARSPVDWSVYRKTILWKVGSKTAHGNLYPLGRKRHAHWPVHNEFIFGISRRMEDQRRYEALVEGARFERLREARKHHQPQAIVCFGKSRWPAFRRALGINAISPIVELATRNLVVHPKERVILAPHFAYGHLQEAHILKIVTTLRGWNVSLPSTGKCGYVSSPQ